MERFVLVGGGIGHEGTREGPFGIPRNHVLDQARVARLIPLEFQPVVEVIRTQEHADADNQQEQPDMLRNPPEMQLRTVIRIHRHSYLGTSIIPR